jgi:hypothetical protein
VVAAFKDKPVKFFAVGASDSLASVKGYVQSTKMDMPAFADNFGLMEARYGFKISLNNIWQMRIVGPDGTVVGQQMTVPAIEQALSRYKVEWRFKGKGFDKALDKAIDAFEWNRWAEGTKLLTPLRKSTTKAVKESAEKLFEELRAEGEKWKTEAEGCAESDPVKAHDLYTQIAAVFAGEELGKATAAALAALKKNKIVIAELAARKYMDECHAVMAKLTPDKRTAALQMFDTVVKRWPGTPSAEKAAALVKELSGAPPAGD